MSKRGDRRHQRNRTARASRQVRPAASDAEPTVRFHYAAASTFVPKRSLTEVLQAFGVEARSQRKALIRSWDSTDDRFYRLLVRALGAWVDMLPGLPMPIRLPPELLLRPVEGEAARDHLMLQHYPFIEATQHLGDSLAAGLDGHPRAAMALLRPFVEAAITEVWANEALDDKRIGRYLAFVRGDDGGRRPRVATMLDQIFAEPRFKALASMRTDIERQYGVVSQGVHVSSIDDALLDMRHGNLTVATLPETVTWLTKTALVVHRMLALLVVRFPMLLFPVDIVSRFGYSPPFGLVDEVLSASVVDGLGERHARALRRHLADDDEVTSWMDFYASRPVLTPDQVEAEWQAWIDTEPTPRARSLDLPTPEARRAFSLSHTGALVWGLIVSQAHRHVKPVPDDLDADRALDSDTLADELVYRDV